MVSDERSKAHCRHVFPDIGNFDLIQGRRVGLLATAFNRLYAPIN